MDVLLIAGLWLPCDVWGDVARALETRGHHAVPVALPGQGDGDTTATLADQEAAVVAAVDAAVGPVLVVGHSAACTLAWIAADRRPDRVATVALVGGFPAADGDRYADVFPVRDGVMPFPGWDRFEGPDADDLDEAARAALTAVAVPVPQQVSQGVVRLTDPRRHTVPVVVVCPEFSPAEAQQWLREGEAPDLAAAEHLSFVDIDSGHWPMVSAVDELVRLLTQIAEQAAQRSSPSPR